MGKKTAEERFLEKVHKDPETGCWLWTAGLFGSGYGCFTYERKLWKAHRWAYMTFVEDPGGLLVCHSCDVCHCVNPQHLWLGTTTDNMRDASAKGRLAKGDRHGSRTKPDRVARGDQNGARLHMECMPRGEIHGMAKLGWDDVRAIRKSYAAGGVSHRQLASQYGLVHAAIGKIVRRETWVE